MCSRREQVPGMRKWLKFERSGRTEILQVDKHAVALQTGVQVWSYNSLLLLPLSPFAKFQGRM